MRAVEGRAGERKKKSTEKDENGGWTELWSCTGTLSQGKQIIKEIRG